MRPCKFESALSRINDSGVLIETTETFQHLSLLAADRLVVASPFLDRHGFEWVLGLFEATKATTRALICRHFEDVAGMPQELLRRLSVAGVLVYEYCLTREATGPNSLQYETFHAKIVLADQVAAYVGSANFLRSSQEISLECGVLIEGNAVQQVYDVVESMLMVAVPKQLLS
jgi:phosphatidylserine/phosphatidylglycerophosphate/cardiolipin synthase-like enzyme